MSSDAPVLRMDGISKMYQIYDQPHHRLLQMIYGPRKLFFREFWALRDIDLVVQPGECLGIIGRNGAGKSTLLQIIAGTLHPTKGRCETRGRVAALLELGSGFNMEFTGRENVRLNATVLGMPEKELEEKLDSILAFADIGAFIDQPVKTYSSGMKMRLAFAVQAHLEPDILIVDEALSVGDGAFQTKCMQRMRHMLERNTTILFVSHSMATVRMFCERVLWMEQGRIVQDGETKEVTSRYSEVLFGPPSASEGPAKEERAPDALAEGEAREAPAPTNGTPHLALLEDVPRSEQLRRWGHGQVRIRSFCLFGETGGLSKVYDFGQRLTLEFDAAVECASLPAPLSAAFALRNRQGLDIVSMSTDRMGLVYETAPAGERLHVRFTFDLRLAPGDYTLILAVAYEEDGRRVYADYVENAHFFTVASDRHHGGLYEPETQAEFLNR